MTSDNKDYVELGAETREEARETERACLRLASRLSAWGEEGSALVLVEAALIARCVAQSKYRADLNQV